MTNAFSPPRPRAYAPSLPLDATSVLDILATHDPALYNRVMQIAAEHCQYGTNVALNGIRSRSQKRISDFML